jgi:iron(III) transport system substrate-binding protein
MLFHIRQCLRLWPVLACCLAIGCGQSPAPRVVVYTALDEIYSRPILDRFEAATGIRVLAVYDTESTKTTGLVTRLIAERSRPRADVFWNNEIAQTIRLQDEGLLEPYRSPAAEAVPLAFKDPNGAWTGLAARARVIIYNRELMPEPPRGLQDFLDPQWKGRAAIALPLFGTTATHAAALFSAWGPEPARQFFHQLRDNEVAVLGGNAAVADFVARGEYLFGLTDTDDANGAIEDGKPVRWVLPDQHDLGTLVIPNTVALLRSAPNAEAGRKLIDYLLSPEVEAALAQMRSIQIPLKPRITPPTSIPPLEDIRVMQVAWPDVARQLGPSSQFLRETFAR